MISLLVVAILVQLLSLLIILFRLLLSLQLQSPSSLLLLSLTLLMSPSSPLSTLAPSRSLLLNSFHKYYLYHEELIFHSIIL